MGNFEEVEIKPKDENNDSNTSKESNHFTNELRPLNFDDYIGQEDIKEDLKVHIKASKIRDTVIPHILLFGAPGLGKTTLAQIIANEKKADLKITTAPTIEKPADLIGTLLSLNKGDILFMDEIHGLNIKLEELLYSVMEDFKIDIPVESGVGKSKLIRMDVKPFTLIGATTRPGLLSQPFKNRFKIDHQLEFYSNEELAQIIEKSATKLRLEIDNDAALEIAKRSRSTARLANGLLERISSYAIVEDKKIDFDLANNCLNKFKIDKVGLSKSDRRYMYYISTKLKNKPTGLKTISQYLSEDEKTIESIIEPYLISKGFVTRTPKGRKLTDLGLEYAKDNISEDVIND